MSNKTFKVPQETFKNFNPHSLNAPCMAFDGNSIPSSCFLCDNLVKLKFVFQN